MPLIHFFSSSLSLSPASGPEGEMTKEDVPEPLEGRDSVLGHHHARLAAHLQHNGTQQAVVHQVASAPMPTDCGESP